MRPGLSDRRIVVIAHRDSLDAPGLADLSGTAALLELARIFRTRTPESEQDTVEPGRPQKLDREPAHTGVAVGSSDLDQNCSVVRGQGPDGLGAHADIAVAVLGAKKICNPHG